MLVISLACVIVTLTYSAMVEEEHAKSHISFVDNVLPREEDARLHH